MRESGLDFFVSIAVVFLRGLGVESGCGDFEDEDRHWCCWVVLWKGDEVEEKDLK